MYSNHPSDAVRPTPVKMAIGAARAAPAVSSEMCAAESSGEMEQHHQRVSKVFHIATKLE